MKLFSMILALVATLACVDSTCAFVMPRAGAAGSASRLAETFTPAVSQLTSSRPNGAVSGLSVKVLLGDDENVEAALSRFRRDVSKSGHLMDLRWRRQFETAAEKKKRKKERSRREERAIRNRERRQRLNQY